MLAQYKEDYTNRLYTLDEAKKVLARETARKIRQKISGLIMLSIGILAPLICDGDASISLFVIPIGLWLLITREDVME